MARTDNIPILALDGGGTRCRLALARGDDVIVEETGSANVSTDLDGAVTRISKAVARLAERSGEGEDVVASAPAYIGLAGMTGPDIAARLRSALPFGMVKIDDDRPAAVRGAFGFEDGILAHCGTGSFYAAQADRAMHFAGGWGPVIGDEASAQWIGRTALGVTLESTDGRRAGSSLSQRFLDKFGGTAGIVRFAGAAAPSDFGALAPVVTELASEGDALAKAVLQAGADEIATALPLIGWRAGMPICLTGGIGPFYGPYLPDEMQAALMAPKATPLAGAISLARDFAKEIARERG